MCIANWSNAEILSGKIVGNRAHTTVFMCIYTNLNNHLMLLKYN